jgi:uroporphyrin-III C-methyltransferase
MKDAIDSSSKLKTPSKHLFLWTTLIFMLCAGAYAGYYFYQSQRQYLVYLEELNHHQHALATETESSITDLKQQISKIKPSEVTKTDLQSALYKARYAIELAQLNAQWGNDTSTTLALLQEADRFLSGYNNAELFPIRRALAHEIVEIKAIPSLDIPGLLSQLDALQQGISEFSYITPKPREATSIETESQPEASAGAHTWINRLKNTLLSLKQFFIIRHHKTPLEPLLSPAFQTAQKEIIRLNLQQASWAILEKNEAIYQLSLKQAKDNIIRVFEPSNQDVQPLLKQLETLQTVNIQIPIFVPNESLPLLETLIQNIALAQPGSSS